MQGLRSHGSVPPDGKMKIGCLRSDWTQTVKQVISSWEGFSWNNPPTLTADRQQ